MPAGDIQTREMEFVPGRDLLHNEVCQLLVRTFPFLTASFVSQFIVYDVSQVKMRYLVTVRSEGNMSL